jgi:hypothetical protein
MDYLWYPLVMKELLENFSTNVCCLFTNNERVGTNFLFFFVRRTKKTYSTRSCVKWVLFGISGPLKRVLNWPTRAKKPNLHTNSLNKLLFFARNNFFLFYGCTRYTLCETANITFSVKNFWPTE